MLTSACLDPDVLGHLRDQGQAVQRRLINATHLSGTQGNKERSETASQAVPTTAPRNNCMAGGKMVACCLTQSHAKYQRVAPSTRECAMHVLTWL